MTFLIGYIPGFMSFARGVFHQQYISGPESSDFSQTSGDLNGSIQQNNKLTGRGQIWKSQS